MKTTGANGEYHFDHLAPGDYYISFVPPGYEQFTQSRVGADRTIDSDADANGYSGIFQVAAGANTEIDAGLVDPPAARGQAWFDADRDGIRAASEPKITGRQVQLFTSSGEFVDETELNEEGEYIFEGLSPGSYFVQFDGPSQWGFTEQDIGPDDQFDSDADAMGRAYFTISSNNDVDNIDAGFAIVKADTNTTVASTDYLPDTGEAINLTATVMTSESDPVSNGIVEFFDGDDFLGRATVSNGTATLSNVVLIGGGSRDIHAHYMGNHDYEPSQGSTALAVNNIFAGDDYGATSLTSTFANPPYRIDPVDIYVAFNDSPVELGDLLKNMSIVVPPSKGSAQILTNSFTNEKFIRYTLGAAYYNAELNSLIAGTGHTVTDTLLYSVEDDHGGKMAATAFINWFGPLDMSLTPGNFDEELPAGTVVGLLGMSNGGETFTYSLISGASNGFAIVGNELRTTRVFNYETLNDNKFEVTIRAVGSGVSKRQTTFLIKVNNVNEAPTNITLSQAAIEEGDYSRFVGDLTGTDIDPSESLSYELLTPSVPFEVFGDQLWSTGHLNAAQNDTYTLSFRVTDASGLTCTKSLTLDILNLAPTLEVIGTLGVRTNEALSYFAYATDPGQTADELVYSLSGTVPSGVAIDADTGELTWTPTTAGVYTFNVVVTDTASPALSDTVSVTVHVGTDPVITSVDAVTFVDGISGSFTFTTTGFPSPEFYIEGDLPAGLTFVDNSNGTATLSGTPTTPGVYTLIVSADNAVGVSAVQIFTIVVNDAPSFDDMEVNGGAIYVVDALGNTPDLAGQNSVVAQLLVTFDVGVTLGAGAFTIDALPVVVTIAGTTTPMAAGTNVVSVIAEPVLDSADPVVGGYKRYRLRFDVSSYTNSFDNSVTGNGGVGNIFTTLKDGFYRLRVHGANVHAGASLSGPAATDANTYFWTLYGCVDPSDTYMSAGDGGSWGDGNSIISVNASLLGWIATNGSQSDTTAPPYVAAFDWNLDGFVADDILEFAKRFGLEWSF